MDPMADIKSIALDPKKHTNGFPVIKVENLHRVYEMGDNRVPRLSGTAN